MSQFSFKRVEDSDVILIRDYMIFDERGSLCKNYASEEFLSNGIDFIPVEETILKSKKNVLRGLHYQSNLCQNRLMTCIEGNLYTVLVDMDYDSENYGRCYTIEFTPNYSLYIPGKYALGTFAQQDSLICLAYSENFIPEYSAGVRWNDDILAIDWPERETLIIAEKDRQLSNFKEKGKRGN